MTNDDLQQASAWTRNYRNQNIGGINAHCLSAETLQGILAQDGCVGVRAYYGLDDAGTPKLVLVGYDAKDNDILPAAPAPEQQSFAKRMLIDEMPAQEQSASIAINLPVCPPCCGTGNSLNS